MKYPTLGWRALLIATSLTFTSAYADNHEEKDGEEKEEKTLADTIEGKTSYEGLFNVYRDPKTGEGYVAVDKAQLDKPILYFASTQNGVVDAGHFRGAFRQYRLIEFRRHFDRLDIVSKTPRFYFDPDSALSKAADANISEAVLVSTKIEFEDDNTMLIKLDEVFKNEQLHRVEPMPSSDTNREKARFKPGKFSKDKSRILNINNFPENTHITVDYVYENDTPKVRGGAEITDPRYTTLTLQHAFVALPENDFKPRRDDSRIGYFTQYFDDMTSDQTANYRDVINRWNLVKKDPDAEVSDPVEPIVWWIENTTPVEWRDTIRDATLAWNSSFEKAGISNAIEVKVQPDDADWSAEDVRYNVLRWTSSPRPPFGGYGPSIANPLTGEIIAADIMLEYNFMKGRWIASRMFTDGVDASEPEFELEGEDQLYCSLGHGLSMNMAFGQTAALANGMGDIEQDRMMRQAMYYLILHEVGHTLGLNHNMRATQMHSPDDAHDMAKTQGVLAGSVMDYPAINYAPPGVEQGDFYSEKPGPYDDWAILYGYSQALDDPEAEEARLEQILSRSMEPELAFANDADDMRQAGRHIDPRVNTWDMSSDAIEYAKDRLELIKSMAATLKDKLLSDGRSHNDLLVGANVLMNEMNRQSGVISRYVGGVYVERAVVGQPGYTQPFTPVPLDTQKRAMSVLSDYIFAPDAIADMEYLFAYLQRQRRGFSGFGDNEDPKLHEMLLTAQKRALDHFLHPNVLTRMTDTSLYGNEYSLEAMMTDLTNAIFEADRKGDVNSFRRNLQVEYVERLIAASGLEKASKHDNIAKAMATYELNRIKELVSSNRGDQATKIHRFYVRDLIDRAFEASRS
ncbi:zinc-dependent metalloprotease [Aestuariibacter salexigens]|uniref:zinc-dependent metalloprotease n=1 Tax=Aestuariibacter salexigens TaxID=226010 RepID=UPI00047D3FB2|nr:zinc-dependent metalloprotease [Aestuariibacter salexigens]